MVYTGKNVCALHVLQCMQAPTHTRYWVPDARARPYRAGRRSLLGSLVEFYPGGKDFVLKQPDDGRGPAALSLIHHHASDGLPNWFWLIHGSAHIFCGTRICTRYTPTFVQRSCRI